MGIAATLIEISGKYGLDLTAAAQEGFEIHVVVTTDGRLGYCSEAEKDNIVNMAAPFHLTDPYTPMPGPVQ